MLPANGFSTKRVSGHTLEKARNVRKRGLALSRIANRSSRPYCGKVGSYIETVVAVFNLKERATYFWLGSCPNKPRHNAVARVTRLFDELVYYHYDFGIFLLSWRAYANPTPCSSFRPLGKGIHT